MPIVIGNEAKRNDKDDTEYVLIDDEEMNRSSWKLTGKIRGKKVTTFDTADKFFLTMKDLDKAVKIYIDSNLSDGIKGEHIAKIIYNKGFKNIYLCTGDAPSDFPVMPWIKEIVGKTPPFFDNELSM